MSSNESLTDFIKNSQDPNEIIEIALNNPDWQIRQMAVSYIDDENILKDIVCNDLSTQVAVTAMEHINDTDFLLDVCFNNPFSHIRLATLNRLCDESLLSSQELSPFLSKVALNDPDDFICQTAVKNPNLTDENVLVKIIKSNRDAAVKREAILKITDEKLLADVALNGPDRFIRNSAIQNPNLTDFNVLCEVMKNDNNEFNRYWACVKINDNQSLLRIIFNQSYYGCLDTLVENFNLKGDDYFREIYENDDDNYRRRVAVRFIKDKEYLESIVLNDLDDEVRLEAVKNRNFTNDELLKKMIFAENNTDIIFEAISKVNDENSLMEYVKNNLKPSITTLKAISRISDSDFLKEIILHGGDREISLEVINKLENRDSLIEAAAFSKDREIKLASLSRIKPASILKAYFSPAGDAESELDKIALSDNDDEIRRLAISKIRDKHVLDEIIRKNDYDLEFAQNRLNTLFDEIKLINRESILQKLIACRDEDISYFAYMQLNDLKTWKTRIREIEKISDIDELSEIALNDFNYYVRCEAEGRLEKILLNIRLDEIKNKSNQEKLKRIADDDTLPADIRRKAYDKLI